MGNGLRAFLEMRIEESGSIDQKAALEAPLIHRVLVESAKKRSLDYARDDRLRGHFGWATVRRYGLMVLKPFGYLAFACSSLTAGGMMTSWPFFQFTGVATMCFAVS